MNKPADVEMDELEAAIEILEEVNGDIEIGVGSFATHAMTDIMGLKELTDFKRQYSGCL